MNTLDMPSKTNVAGFPRRHTQALVLHTATTQGKIVSKNSAELFALLKKIR